MPDSLNEINTLDVEPSVSQFNADPIADLADSIVNTQTATGGIRLRGTQLDNVAWHDFHSCTYLLDPKIVDTPQSPDYLKPYMVFNPYSVNFGLRLVYRQEWRPLGNQRGEIVKTIPLGPGQLEKVSTKIVRRTKVSHQTENLRSMETTTETSESTKDSIEVIREAASNFNWHVDTEASVEVGFDMYKASGSAAAGVQAGVAGSTDVKSRETSAKLSEAMQKTASRIRNETKTVISTESESTDELTTASEIRNPNDAIAITYVYSKLQRQYEVFTGLAEAHNVVMVALPMPDKIDFNWVKRHDWILAKALLDDSYRDALNEISTGTEEIEETGLEEEIKAPSKTLLEGAPNIQTLSLSGSIDDEAYRDRIKVERERAQEHKVREAKFERLYHHIRDNIFHYMRAVWSQTDPEQRLLELKRAFAESPDKRIAREWEFDGYCGKLPRDKHPVEDVLKEIVANEISNYAPDEPTTLEELEAQLEEIRNQYNADRDAALAQLREATTAEFRTKREKKIEAIDNERQLAIGALETICRETVAKAALLEKVKAKRLEVASAYRSVERARNQSKPGEVPWFAITVPNDNIEAVDRAAVRLKADIESRLRQYGG